MPNTRRTRPGKGRAFLKFLIGLLAVFILGAGAYLFVLEYDRIPGPPVQSAGVPEPTMLAQPGTTPEPTAEPVQTQAPAVTQAPEDIMSTLQEGMSVPVETENATFGMIDFRPTEQALEVSAYLSAPGISSQNARYYIVATLMNGEASYVFDTWQVENITGLDIDLACFSAKFSTLELADGWYRLGLMAEYGEHSCYVSIADTAYSFVVSGGQLIRYAE